MAVAISATAYYLVTAPQRRAEAGLQSAIATVRADSLPANAADFRQMLGKPQGANAFDVLATLEPRHRANIKDGKRSALSIRSEEFRDSETRLEFAHYLAAFDDASKCDSYVADRDWEHGLVTLFADFAHTKVAARINKVTAELAIERGDLDEALETAEKMNRVASFLRSERHLIAVLVGDAIDVMAYELLFSASTRFDSDQWRRAQSIVDRILPTLSAKEALVGDMVMFLETVDDVCEGGPNAKDLMVAAQAADGPRSLKPMSAKSSAAIRAEARTLWVEIFDAAKDIKDTSPANKAYERLFERMIAWSLFDEFPIEVAKTIESLGTSDSIFDGLYRRALRGDMVRLAFSIVRQGEHPADGDELISPSALGMCVFARIPGGFVLTHDNGGRPIEVFYPKKP